MRNRYRNILFGLRHGVKKARIIVDQGVLVGSEASLLLLALIGLPMLLFFAGLATLFFAAFFFGADRNC